MNKLIKQLFSLSLLVLLNACVTDQKYKVRFEPTLPIPYLIVPDNESKNSNDRDRRDRQYQRHKNNHRDEYQRDNNNDSGNGGEQQYENDDYLGY